MMQTPAAAERILHVACIHKNPELKKLMPNNALNTPLSDEEYEALDVFLAVPEFGGRAMDVSTLEGFLTALAIGPNLVMPGQWLPWVWDMEEGVAGMPHAGVEDAGRIIGLVMRHYNHMVQWLQDDPGSFEPICDCGPEWGAAEWCEGFLLGTQLDAAAWAPLFVSQPAWFAPFMRLGTKDGLELTRKDDDAERWMSEVAPAVVTINAFWMEQRRRQHLGSQPQRRDAPKVGRNDPCTCGSGKKYKKCCADAEAA